MGVPAFYRWLLDKYPEVRVDAVEQHKPYNNSSSNGSNMSNRNNCLEFDNLYLDMNGIIHPCFHPHHLISTPTTFEQVFENIFAYIDRLLNIVRPHKLLFLAIDGVAPRAKMNQQRSRRFKSAKDNQIAEDEERRLRKLFENKGKTLLPKQQSEVSDSNVITPGTEFMHELSRALNLYIHRKLKNDPTWGHLQVILSDATVPGEGEHKIIAFIRSSRCLPGYDPNTRHCLYGLDADLIMLALATHELHFSILREVVLTVQQQAPISESALLTSIQKSEQHSLANSGEDKPKPFFDIGDKMRSLLIQPQHYEFLHIWILREYLELDMQIEDPPQKFVYDIERIVDDFIFLCFFVGNDFLPHMPTLEIHENAMDLLMYIYKKEFKSIGGYLVDMQRIDDQHAAYIKLKRVEKFILSVGCYEDKIFQKRTEIRDKEQRRISAQLSESESNEQQEHDGFEVGGTGLMEHEAGNVPQNDSSSNIQEMVANTKELNEMLKKNLRQKSDIFKNGNLERDKVKLGSPGWKSRYYKEKFSVEDPKEVEILRKEMVHKYTEGLCWVLLYYFSGVPSWNWYYPYHYGPFASDLKGLSGIKVRFEKGYPFKPFDQLMAVLPPTSAHALPIVYKELMTESSSSIIQFYPTDFEVDVDGKRFMWQGICKLPFINQEKLLKATKEVELKVMESEAIRNVQSTEKLYVRASNSSERGFGGYLQLTKIEDGILCNHFELPAICSQKPRLLEGIQPPDKKILEKNIKKTVLWHEYCGRPPITGHWERQRIPVDAGGTIRTVGPGRGFEPAGRGKGTTTNTYPTYNNVNGRYGCQSQYMQSTSSFPRNVNRDMENSRIQNCSVNRSRNTDSQNSFWSSRNGNAPYGGNASSLVSHTRTTYSTPGNEESLGPQFRPHNPQFMSRGRGGGRGRGRSRPQM